ncbi:MAG: ATP-binding protein, partial [Alphaproteobacteria bacterium]|nr:ATP-binding protein [Alphaproteobacteria bacterium]
RHRDAPRPSDVRVEIIQRSGYLATAVGLVWGLGCAYLYPANAPEQQMFLAMVVAGMGAGGAAGLASVPRASIGFAGALLLPFMVRVLWEGTTLNQAMAAMGVLFIGVVVVLSRSSYAGFLDAVRMRVANDGLLRDLEAARADLLDAVASTSEAFAFYDENDRLQVFNDNYLNMLSDLPTPPRQGMTFAEINQAMPPPLLCEGRRMAAEEWRQWRLRQHRECAGSFQQKHHSGRWMLTADRRTRRGGTVTVHVDITDLKAREDELKLARDEAQGANRAKSEFLALMSHELRTPLNAILGFSEILREESFGPHHDKRYVEYAQNIFDSGSHLLRMITEILDLSKIEAGKFELYPEEFELAQPFEDIRRIMGHTAQGADLTLTVEPADGLRPIYADLRAVRQMLINLVANAVKFTPPGGRVTVSARQTEDETEITVVDSGVGIAEADIPRVLEPFSQVDGPMNRRHEGTGLGLPLVRSLMQLHGGELRIDSMVDAGTTVRLLFPRQEQSPAEPA